MDRMIARTEADRRFVRILFEVFGLIALVPAEVGIYGMHSGNVRERTQAMGVGAAWGASGSNILALVLGDRMRLTGFGIAAGLSGALLASRTITTVLFFPSPLDPIASVEVIRMLAGVSVLACWVPAWRASCVNPLIALRAACHIELICPSNLACQAAPSFIKH